MKRHTVTIERPSIGEQLASLFWLGLATFITVAVIGANYAEGELLRGFYLVMGGDVAVGLIAAFLGFVAFAKEARAQKALLEHLNGRELWSTIRDWQQDSYSWRVLYCVREQQFVSPKSVREEGFLDGMQTRLEAPARFVRGCGDVCLSLGLLGTAAGLAVMLEDLQLFAAAGKLSDGDGDVFSALFGPTGPVRNLAASFSTTVVGLAARLVLSMLGTVLQAGADRLTDYLADRIAMTIGPASGQGGAAA